MRTMLAMRPAFHSQRKPLTGSDAIIDRIPRPPCRFFAKASAHRHLSQLLARQTLLEFPARNNFFENSGLVDAITESRALYRRKSTIFTIRPDSITFAKIVVLATPPIFGQHQFISVIIINNDRTRLRT
ncbi:MAG: hypothetical protein U5L96_19825 [Owenweeksia sp.]|nr:hypothetical protein [Owenweeksia sp.]